MLGNVYVTATPAFSRPVLPAVTVTKSHFAPGKVCAGVMRVHGWEVQGPESLNVCFLSLFECSRPFADS